MSDDAEETLPPIPPAVCHLSGGPQDGVRHVFRILPFMLVDELDGGFYQRTGDIAEDGAHLFEYHKPERDLCHPSRVS